MYQPVAVAVVDVMMCQMSSMCLFGAVVEMMISYVVVAMMIFYAVVVEKQVHIALDTVHTLTMVMVVVDGVDNLDNEQEQVVDDTLHSIDVLAIHGLRLS